VSLQGTTDRLKSQVAKYQLLSIAKIKRLLQAAQA